MADQAEGTFGRLRYLLGGDRPSQTTHLALFLIRIHGPRLDSQHRKGGISRLTPRELAPSLLRLPPILHNLYQKPIPDCSKGARGLSVLLQLTSIFTRTSISLGLWLRQ